METCKSFKPYILNEPVALKQIQRLKTKAVKENALIDGQNEFDEWAIYDEKFIGDDCVFIKRDGDVKDGFIGGDIKDAKASTKLQQFQYEVCCLVHLYFFLLSVY